jgi:hypothetical protein
LWKHVVNEPLGSTHVRSRWDAARIHKRMVRLPVRTAGGLHKIGGGYRPNVRHVERAVERMVRGLRHVLVGERLPAEVEVEVYQHPPNPWVTREGRITNRFQVGPRFHVVRQVTGDKRGELWRLLLNRRMAFTVFCTPRTLVRLLP